MSIKLGDRVRDRINGFEGIAYGIAKYMTGCTQVCVLPETLMSDGKIRDSHWLDLDRLDVIQPAASFPVTSPGGPSDYNAPTK